MVDQMCRRYSTRFTTRRWPLRHFQNILDIGALNTETLYKECHPGWSGQRENHGRRVFLKNVEPGTDERTHAAPPADNAYAADFGAQRYWTLRYDTVSKLIVAN